MRGRGAGRQHWHIDIATLNIRGTFFYLCTVLEGCSRLIVHHEVRESMKERADEDDAHNISQPQHQTLPFESSS